MCSLSWPPVPDLVEGFLRAPLIAIYNNSWLITEHSHHVRVSWKLIPRTLLHSLWEETGLIGENPRTSFDKVFTITSDEPHDFINETPIASDYLFLPKSNCH